MEQNPWEKIFAGIKILVIGLMHVPEEGNKNTFHNYYYRLPDKILKANSNYQITRNNLQKNNPGTCNVLSSLQLATLQPATFCLFCNPQLFLSHINVPECNRLVYFHNTDSTSI